MSSERGDDISGQWEMALPSVFTGALWLERGI